MRARSLVPAVLVLAGLIGAYAATTACNGATSDPGDDAYMRVHGAQFVRGRMPTGSAAGPKVLSLDTINSLIYPNLPNYSIGGALGATATSAAIGLQGDVGYWIVVAGVANYTTPTDPSYAANAGFSGSLIAGKYTLLVRGVDAQGNFGLPSSQILTGLAAPPLEPIPTGALVVTLTWSGDANLDLHVVDPTGDDLYWGTQSTQPPFAFDQVDGGSFGTIDYDSNANCVIDGLDREDAVWAGAPPLGTYIVRVDAASLCVEPDAYWTVKVVLQGKTLGEATGTATDADTRGTHGFGSGVTALSFSVQ
jgi:hypothetical protein